jgi:hypothetical protein
MRVIGKGRPEFHSLPRKRLGKDEKSGRNAKINKVLKNKTPDKVFPAFDGKSRDHPS